MKFIARLVIMALVILVVAYILPGIVIFEGLTFGGFSTALIVAVVLGVINALLKPILMVLVLPINMLTLGLFTFVVNAFLLMVVSWIVPGFMVLDFISALIGALLISVVSTFVSKMVT